MISIASKCRKIYLRNHESYESLGEIILRERTRALLDKHSFKVSLYLHIISYDNWEGRVWEYLHTSSCKCFSIWILSLNMYFIIYYTIHYLFLISYLVLTNLKPTYAKRLFPCFDEPDLRAKFQLTISHSDKLKVVTSMPVTKFVSGLLLVFLFLIFVFLNSHEILCCYMPLHSMILAGSLS